MATKQEMEIIITPDGQVKLEVKGLKGPGCLLEVKKLADALGEVREQEFTSEYYEKEQQQTRAKRQT